MLTFFINNSDESSSLYYLISNSLQITNPQQQSSTYKFAGLYAIYREGVCYYVGQSQNIASRLAQHLTRTYLKADKIQVFFASDGYSCFYDLPKKDKDAILLANEHELMKALKPIENINYQEPDKNEELLFIDADTQPCAEIFKIKNDYIVSSDIHPSFYELKQIIRGI